jgi:hypothetical protein
MDCSEGYCNSGGSCLAVDTAGTAQGTYKDSSGNCVTCDSGYKVNSTMDGCEAAVVCNNDTPKTNTDCWTPECNLFESTATLPCSISQTISVYNSVEFKRNTCRGASGSSYGDGRIFISDYAWRTCSSSDMDSNRAFLVANFPGDGTWKVRISGSSIMFGCGYLQSPTILNYIACNINYSKAWDW